MTSIENGGGGGLLHATAHPAIPRSAIHCTPAVLFLGRPEFTNMSCTEMVGLTSCVPTCYMKSNNCKNFSVIWKYD